MNPRVLVLNSGSSSVKYQLVDLAERRALASGLVERIGEPLGRHTHSAGDGPVLERDLVVADHEAAFAAISAAFEATGSSLVEGDLTGIGHRVVHGGERYQEPTLLTPAVVERLEDLVPLAPLHNPANLAGIRVTLRARPDVPQVAVFDTAFHRTMPRRAFLYALPLTLYEQHAVRRYGFHGTSHQYVTKRAAALVGRPLDEVNLVSFHLGNGASACAVRGGRSVDTSMGLTPLEGLVMGTRCGDVDAGVLFHLHRTTGASIDDLDDLLNKQSGLKGLSGHNDWRVVRQLADTGDVAAMVAVEVFCYRLRKYLGAYTAVLGRLDAVVFTAGIGEHAADVRALTCEGLEGLGIVLDPVRNQADGGGERVVSADGSPVAVLVIPTNEELEIAEQSYASVLAAGRGSAGPR